jgi:hypothetical protein
MPPLLSSTFGAQYDVRPQTGFTRGLMDSILVSKSKLKQWAEFEKAKADKVAEEYRQQLLQEQATIDAKVTSLLAVQLERGLNVQGKNDDDDQAESIATRKKALEEQRAALEVEIVKLQTEYQNREKRVQGEY